jgi:citrate lyase subunit beta-like protein
VQVSFEINDRLGKGSYSLDGKMIDAPVYKQVSSPCLFVTTRDEGRADGIQALRVLLKARAAGMAIPEISEDDVKA